MNKIRMGVKHLISNLCVFAMLALSSCSSNIVYQDAATIDPDGWYKRDIVSFDYTSTDTIGTYNIILDVRNDASYPYKNFWVFVHSVAPNQAEYSDTLECVLADNYGRWIGKSSGSQYALPVLFLSNTQFRQKGNFHFDIIQGMREDTLHGIKEIGIRIEKVESNNE